MSLGGDDLMPRGLAVVLLAISFLLLALIIGCGGESKIKQVQVGMTFQEVEEILGEPIHVGPGARETLEHRYYKGDGNNEISVTFENGVVKSVREIKPRYRLPVGHVFVCACVQNSQAQGNPFWLPRAFISERP
jgi:hypothetical protein